MHTTPDQVMQRTENQLPSRLVAFLCLSIFPLIYVLGKALLYLLK